MAPICKKSHRNEMANTHEPSENKGQFHFKSTVKCQHFKNMKKLEKLGDFRANLNST